ncbi:MAG: hypothetical protein ACSLEX_03310 [Minisyncoccota bacterium]
MLTPQEGPKLSSAENIHSKPASDLSLEELQYLLAQKQTGEKTTVAPEGNTEQMDTKTPQENAVNNEREITPEQLQENIKRLESNITKMDAIPEAVLQSPEGQEATQSLQEKLIGKLGSFRNGLVEKLATLDNWKGTDRMVSVLGGATGAAILTPLAIQLARSKWPEVGVALDMAPDMLQQFVHMDVWAKIIDMLGNGDILQNGSVWKDGGIEVNNLLADISSGKESLLNLQPDQLQILKDGMSGNEFEVLTNPKVNSADYAKSVGNVTTVVRNVFGNMGPIIAGAAGLGFLMSKIGSMANKFKQKHA